MSDIFISYDKGDRSKVEPLAKVLQGLGWVVWWDRNIPAGKEWRKTIEKALDEAKCVIVVWSKKSVNSNFVLAEAEEGQSRDILVPVLIEDVRIPLGFRQIQAANLIGWNKSQTHPEFNKLKDAIRLRVPILTEHTGPKKEGSTRTPQPRRFLVWLWLGSFAILLLIFIVLFISQKNGMEIPKIWPIMVEKFGWKPRIVFPERWEADLEETPMKVIPEGKFLMGNNEGSSDERPEHWVNVSEFKMDVHEVTLAQYTKHLERTSPEEMPEWWNDAMSVTHANVPIVGVSWAFAKAYCESKEKRLPTEAEWEKAARGTDGRTYPWGDEKPTGGNKLANFDPFAEEKRSGTYETPGYYNVFTDKLEPVGSYPAGKSPYGILDMAGSVSEWVSDWRSKNYYNKSPQKDPTGPSRGRAKIQRGGSWRKSANMVRSAFRNWKDLKKINVETGSLEESDDETGFRCVMDVNPQGREESNQSMAEQSNEVTFDASEGVNGKEPPSNLPIQQEPLKGFTPPTIR